MFEKGWMRASIDLVWTALEACQEEVLTQLSKPGSLFRRFLNRNCTRFLLFRCQRIGVELDSLGVWLLPFQLPLFCLWNHNFFILRILFIWLLVAECFALWHRLLFPSFKGQDLAHVKRAFLPSHKLELRKTGSVYHLVRGFCFLQNRRTLRWILLPRVASKYRQNVRSKIACVLVRPTRYISKHNKSVKSLQICNKSVCDKLW